MNDMTYDVLIIGAGASGLFCAWQCAQQGKKTLLVEKETQVGRKVLASGNGRCNLTNAFVCMSDYRGAPQLAATVLQQFPFSRCISLFNELGVVTRQEEQGRVFPLTGKSTAVVDSLRLACQEAGVVLQTQTHIVQLRKKQNLFVAQAAGGAIYRAKHCVLACGSCAYPQLGGSTDGYELARSLGHQMVPFSPTLCALNIKEKALARLQGIRLQAQLQAWPNTPQVVSSRGEILFTAYGVSGPAVLNLSGLIGRALSKGPVPLAMDLLPDVTDKDSFIQQRMQQFSSRSAKAFLTGLLHENIANLLIDFAGVRKNMPVSSWTENTRRSVVHLLDAWPMTAVALRPWTEAMAAAGGVEAEQVNAQTLQSNRCPGLYIIGELLNVDGRSGGFNLHFAWACAYIAAAAISKE